MQAKDLTAAMPRRWTEQVDGIYWLGRLIDKANAAAHGTLGDYLYGQSPMDDWLLRALNIDYPTFTSIVAQAADDAAVLAALAARSPNALERARAWSATLPRRQAFYLWFIDIDEGYLGEAWRPVKTLFNALSGPLSRTIKRVAPSRTS